LPADIAYKIKYDNDVETMSSDFSNQYDELYQFGAYYKYKNYKEEYEYLHLFILIKINYLQTL
jgi:hypothetical protein